MGISRRELARRAGVSPSHITNAIAGDVLGEAAAARIGHVIGWTADEVLRGERIIKREPDRESEHVSPQPLDPPRRDESNRPPNKPDSGQAWGAA